jgi:hypothetical protein
LLGKLLSEPEGRAYFYDLLVSCHVYSTSFATNALAMAFREGERSIGLKLGADIEEANPDALMLMLKEANDERRNRTEPNPDGDGPDPFDPDA